MKNLAPVALATLVLAGLSGVAHADLNYNGEVGLPINPTAQVPETGGFRLQGNYYDLGSKRRLFSVGGAIRASQTAPIEVNGAINDISGGGLGSKADFSVGAKYLFTRETDPLAVRIAAGVGYSQYGLGNLAALGNVTAKNTRGYLVATKSFGNVVPGAGAASITAHLGLRYDNYNFGASSGFAKTKSSQLSVYAGAEVPLVRTGEFQAVGEIGSKTLKKSFQSNTPYSLGLRYRGTGNPFGATIGIQRLDIGNNKAHLFAQIGYTFGR